MAIGHRRKLLDAIAALGGPTRQRWRPRPELEGERRQVTVVFADLAGYTALSRELDAEEVHAFLERFFTCTDRLVAEHGGRIDKHVGDCVMAVFGAPVAHGNDAERAVRAALAIRDAMPTVAAEAGRPVTVHIGVAGGEVVASGTGSVTHREYTITGDSVNLAARLTDAARPGEILVSDAVRRTLVDRLDCEETGALAVKGLADPVLAWRLRGISAPSASARRPLVGRDVELGQFRAVLDACVGSGRGRAVLVRGEAGNRQDPSDRGVPGHGREGRPRLPCRARARLRCRHRPGRRQDPRARAARPRPPRRRGRGRPCGRGRRARGRGGRRVPQRPSRPAAAGRAARALRRHGQRQPQPGQARDRGAAGRAGKRPHATAPRRRGRALGGPADARASGPTRRHRRRRPRRPGDDHPHRGRPARPGLARRGRE